MAISPLYSFGGIGNGFASDANRQKQIINQLMGISSPLNGSHFSQVRYMREKFKEYSEEEFRKLSSDPMVKELLSGMAEVPKEEIAIRIKTYMEQM